MDIVFASSRGRVHHHSNLVKYGLIPAQLAAGIVAPDGKAKYTGLHALRHFYASWCINRQSDGGLGLTPKLVQERLGHATIGMTLDVYGHLFPRGDDGSELAAAEKSLLG
jgi:integrase